MMAAPMAAVVRMAFPIFLLSTVRLRENRNIPSFCAHQLSARAMVLGAERKVTVQLPKGSRKHLFLSVDGGRAFKMNMGDTATIVCSRLETRLVRLKDRSFYDIINNKFKHGV